MKQILLTAGVWYLCMAWVVLFGLSFNEVSNSWRWLVVRALLWPRLLWSGRAHDEAYREWKKNGGAL